MRSLTLLSATLLLAACSGATESNPSTGSGGVAGSVAQAGTGGVAAGGKSSGGASADAGTPSAGGQGGDSVASECEQERARLEQSMTEALDAAATDNTITKDPDFTLALEAADGHRFVYSHGNSSLETVYESASTSKWVAAAVILDLVDRGTLALDDEPSKWLPFWQAQGVTLAHLLSFTSGFSKEPLCINLKNADFADCVERAYDANVGVAPAPGSAFDYSSTHLQIAGLMAIRAAGAPSFAALFEDWQRRTGLFPSGAFDLPSLENPRLAGGMHWTGAEYLEFLRALNAGAILAPATRAAMLDNQRGAAKVIDSPTLDGIGQDWAYGFGNWLECPTALSADTFDCGSGHRNSSPGAYGAYPFIDFDHHYLGILARQGALGTFRDGDSLFGVVAHDAALWGDACSPSSP